MNALAERVLEHPLVYRTWQAPFAEQKLAPLFEHGGVSTARRVLDVGCGPGTNTRHFAHADYVGIDINADYVASARRKHARTFVVGDVTELRALPEDRFDCILVNSLLHHIDTESVRRLLRHLATLLTDDGHIHVLDLVLPDTPSPARLLARLDRGDYPRPLDEWQRLFEESFTQVVWKPYPLGPLGIALWQMVYFKGKRRP